MMSHRGEKSREKGGNNKIFQASILQEVCYTKTHHKKPPSQCRQISNRPAILLSMGHPSFPSLDVGFKPGLKNMMIHFPPKKSWVKLWKNKSLKSYRPPSFPIPPVWILGVFWRLGSTSSKRKIPAEPSRVGFPIFKRKEPFGKPLGKEVVQPDSPPKNHGES